MFQNGSLFFKIAAFIRVSQVRRLLYGVKHNAKRGIFYIRLEDDVPRGAHLCPPDTAVLSYRADGKVLDMRSINVPSHHEGRGLARLLAEAALTYAIVNDYYLLLTCEYMQKFYLSTKTPELEERVLGPRDILNDIDSADNTESSSFDSLPEPTDFIGPPSAK